MGLHTREVPMPSSLLQSRLSLGLVAVLGSACSRGCGSPPTRQSESTTPKASTVTSDEIHVAPGDPIEKVLQGRISGVVVSSAPDGGISVRIRGATSFNGNNEPLYVMDGVPIQAGPRSEERRVGKEGRPGQSCELS